MIAEACIAAQLPPEAFGVAASVELGAVMIEILAERAKDAKARSLHERLRRGR